MIYDIRLRIDYDYDNPAIGGRHLACLMPEDSPGQRLIAGLLDLSPAPAERADRRDFFGNRVTEFAYRGAQADLALTLTARVDRSLAPPPAPGTPLADLTAVLADWCDIGPASPLHFRAPSARVVPDAAITAFARAHVAPDMPASSALFALGGALHRHMRFDAEATTVDTPASEAFALREGVCQDFSHILITALRAVGIPAAYVSGFLRTLPPPGKPRLEGADAMHAWVAAWCGPDAGWIEFDPTNDCGVGTDHIVVARGRDYSDVSPIKGILRVSGRQNSHQAVDVIPVG